MSNLLPRIPYSDRSHRLAKELQTFFRSLDLGLGDGSCQDPETPVSQRFSTTALPTCTTHLAPWC